jgi:hypothetical protein
MEFTILYRYFILILKENVQGRLHLFPSIDALMAKAFRTAAQQSDTAAGVLDSSNSTIAKGLRLYLVPLFWRTAEMGKSKEAAARHKAPTIRGER